MKNTPRSKGSRWYRFSIYALSALLALLLFWLLGFVVRDIGNIEGPDYEVIENQFVDEETRVALENLTDEQRAIGVQIQNQERIQAILRQSTNESRTTMNQLIDLHRLSLEKEVTPTEAEQNALSESETLFLAKQKEFQTANEKIAGLNEQQRTIEQQIQSLNDQKSDGVTLAREEYDVLVRNHRLKVAGLKLLFVVPVLLLSAWLMMKYRHGAYASIFGALLISSFSRVGVVINQYFPDEWFRYIATAAGIVVVLAFLIQLIRTAASPRADWLLKQYRLAYNQHRCPQCAYPILRGPMRHATWTSKGPKPIAAPHDSDTEGEKAYTCPACGEQLFEHCEQCNAIRHSLLPFCDSCGHEKEFVTGHKDATPKSAV